MEIRIQMKKINFKKLYKRLFVLIFAIYIIYTFIAQQQTLNAYKAEATKYNEEIEKLKYEQILQDVINNSKAELKGIPLDGFGQMIRIPDLIVSKLEKIIAEKFNVKIED